MSSIELRNVCLDYIIKTGSDSIKKTAVHLCNKFLRKTPVASTGIKNSSYRALNNINLDIGIGDRVGLLGQNGAGKSTLLRVLAKIYTPNIGSVKINGKTSTLFDVNLGMNEEATGYENIINLTIMRGFSKQEGLMIVDDIKAFTELGDFIDNPVRTYSTGMRMKLAFGVATAFHPDIMLIDEIISVGDAVFINKARNRINKVIEKSNILVITTHDNKTIKEFCNKTVVLKKGEIQFFGDVDDGIKFYTEQINRQAEKIQPVKQPKQLVTNQ